MSKHFALNLTTFGHKTCTCIYMYSTIFQIQQWVLLREILIPFAIGLLTYDKNRQDSLQHIFKRCYYWWEATLSQG